MTRILGLLALTALSACAGSSDYHAVSSFVVANTNVVYVSVGKQNRELTSCENWKSSGCLLVDTKFVYTDSRLVVVDAHSGAQHDLVISARAGDFASYGPGAFTQTTLPNTTPWADLTKRPDVQAVSPSGLVANFWYELDGQTAPALLLGPDQTTSVDVGRLPSTIYVGANDINVTMVSVAPLQVAQFRWEGPVDTKLESVPLTLLDGEYGFEFVSLSPHGERLLLQSVDAENKALPRPSYIIVSLPSGERISKLEFDTAPEFEWIGEGHLAVNSAKPNAETRIYDIATAESTPADEYFKFNGRSSMAGSDILVTPSRVLTPEGKVTKIDSSGGFMVEKRRGWGINEAGEIITYDFDRKTSRSLGRLGPSTTLIGKTKAGLVVFDHRTPAKIWTINPDHGARRHVVISTTTAEGVEEVGGY